MILYLSSGTSQSLFESYQNSGVVNCGFQAQKFNYLIISGLAQLTDITAVGNPPYANSAAEVAERIVTEDRATYICIKNVKGRLHKLSNLKYMYSACNRAFQFGNVEGIICDAINPLAALLAHHFARRMHVKAIAVVTDLPFYMDQGQVSIFTRLTQYLLERFDGYVLLTEAMNPLVNKRNRPYIIMEGLCDAGSMGTYAAKAGQERFVCVYTGSLSKGTGIEELVNAVQDMQESHIELNIYGRGELADWIQQSSAACPRIQYKGAVTNQEAVATQRRADLLINPRPTNIAYGNVSFPSKIMEYMASGTPVLTTRLPGIPKEYFDYVYAIEDDSAQGIKTAIQQLLVCSRNELIKKGKMARNFVLERKNNVVQAKRIYELMRNDECR